MKAYEKYNRISNAISYARSLIGFQYYWPTASSGNAMAGNDDPILGFDCSGLASEICRAVGWIGPYERLSSNQFRQRFRDVGMPARPGDFILYGDAPDHSYHISFVIDGYHIIEAGGGTQGVDTPEEAAYRNAFVRIRPIEFRKSEIIAVIRPGEDQ